MRARTATTMIMAMTLLVLVALPAAAQEPSHGGSMTNTHNDLYIVQGDAENPQGIEAGYGFMDIRETISFANDDPLKVPDYGIIYVDPSFNPDPDTPIVIEYTHDYSIVNYTLQLFNVTDGYVGNFTGFTTTTASLQPGIDLGPEGPDEPHPKVNATYLWQVWAVSAQNRRLFNEIGDQTTTEIFNATVFDWSELPLPEIGPHTYEADADDLNQLTNRSIMEDHPDLSDGWYRFLITENVFEYGVNLTIELRYTGEMTGGRVVMNKLIFNPRTIHLDVFHKSDIEVLMYNDVEGKGTQISPTQSSSGSGDPTKFTYESTLSLVVQEEGTDEIDWAQYGRYALLGLLIAVLLILVLWSGRGKGSTEREEEEEDPEVAEERAELEARKAAILAQIKELDRRHDEGELGEGVWNRKRKTLKGRAVEVMRELEELDGAPPDVEDLPEATGERAELLAEKEEILDRIRDLDHRHDEGVISDETWKRKRKHLKAEAVEIMQEIEALDEE